jgi:hypothetical protein
VRRSDDQGEGENGGGDAGSGRGRPASVIVSSPTLPNPAIAIAVNNFQGGLFGNGPAVEVNTADIGNIIASLDNLLADPPLPAAKSDDGMAAVHKLTRTDALPADLASDFLDFTLAAR